ncbi:D-3-phosphoglycerate dehydrogenase [Desulfamplus magnetovallimortis]|uniref:D-3-phosphoglycerate dehydrogenase n=1 Tax=Desulfamplus magnetovallimortis TaxID=1246637 RepID=A0A1W1H939_9BACT|nr:phosphoglycerate dehydrogenase [Desulfamplus magnetovallimortis]SLM28997.1 D-3-phosphoglycerate dehydrogenase [Desulfamplus magnetovallimortis]
MKVLVSDKMGEAGLDIFRNEEGIELDVKTGLSPEELKEIIGQYDGLAIRSATKVTSDIINAATNLKVIGRAGIGLDNVDIPAATQKGIAVMNTPGGNTRTTAEHAIAMMMSLTRNIPQGTATLKQSLWEKKNLQGRELFDKTLGLIGFGNIGSIVASLAQGLKMKVIIFDPNVTCEHIEKSGYECVTLEELYQRSDYITIHVPKLESTTNLLNKAAFEMMKQGVMIINCARGGIIHEGDLYDAIVSGKVAGAALDVFETEPPKGNPLLTLDRVIATPHLGASTQEAQTNVAVAVANQIIAYLKYNTIINAVNVPSVTGELLKKLQPYLYLAERIGKMHTFMTQGPIKEINIEYAGNFMDLDLKPVTLAAVRGILTPLVKYEVNSVNANALARNMGIKISESTSQESAHYINLIRMQVTYEDGTNLISGTIFGKDDARIIRINKFRLEVVPEGYLSLIHNKDVPGAIGDIGTCLGKHNINIGRMMVGREDDGDRNIIFIRTDTPVSEEVSNEIESLDKVHSIINFEF